MEDEKLYIFLIISNVSTFSNLSNISKKITAEKKKENIGLGKIEHFRIKREPMSYKDMARTMVTHMNFLKQKEMIQHFNTFFYSQNFFPSSYEKKNEIENFLTSETINLFPKKEKKKFFLKMY